MQKLKFLKYVMTILWLQPVMHAAQAPAKWVAKVEIGVFNALEGRNTGKQYYHVPIRNKRIFAKDIIDAYCNLFRGRLSEDIQLKYRYESPDISYASDSDSSDLPKFKCCKVTDLYKYKLFATKRFISDNHKKVELAAFGQLEKDCEEEYESEV